MMKKVIRMVMMSLCMMVVSIVVEAAPALRIGTTVKQTDGTMLTIVTHGDEHHHWMATTDGTIVISTDKGYYVAQIDEQGKLSATDVLAHEPVLRSIEEQEVVSRQQKRQVLFHEQGMKEARRRVSVAKGSYLQHTGSPRILTILAGFQNVGFTVNNPVVAFKQYLNGEKQEDLGNQNQMNIASVRQYFETSSQGQFTPQFDVVGPVTLPQKLSYYGGSSSTGTDERFSTFCKDAMQQAKELVSDWSVYDNDGDGKIELVCVIFAGYGQNQGGPDSTLWAKASIENIKVDSKLTITRFNCCSELFHPQYPDYINGTGVFIHEFSHCMGLPDLYATTPSAYINNQGMEIWSIMDYGLYTNNGYAPSPYNAWEQEVMGWLKMEEIKGEKEEVKYEMMPVLEGGKAYKLVNSSNDRDFIVMENVQKRGLNQYARGNGMLVYHIDYPYSTVNMMDYPNNDAEHPGVAVVPAGGIFINTYLRQDETYTNKEWKESMAASTFPGTKGVTSLTDKMQLPNYCFYNSDTAKATETRLSNITEDEETGLVSFTIAAEGTSSIDAIQTDVEKGKTTIYDLQGRKITTKPQKGVYIMNGKLVVI